MQEVIESLFFRCRASAAGKLMTNGRGKDAGMGETAKSYIKEWFISQLTSKEKQIDSKYLRRGNDMEKAAIARVGNYYGVELKKNEVQLNNEFFQGTFDTIIEGKMVIDTKVPFDAFTFPYFVDEIPKDYFLQLQIYMNLTNTPKAALCYCLENGTEEQINRLAWKLANEKGKEEFDIEEWDEAEQQLSYDHLPEEMRIKVYEFDYDHSVIEQLQKRVLEAREYINNELIPKIKIK